LRKRAERMLEEGEEDGVRGEEEKAEKGGKG
jgi:hypothetical protein